MNPFEAINLGDLLPQVETMYACVVGVETVPLRAALGRISACDLKAACRVPAFDCSSVDGWAVHADDLAETGGVLPVGGRIAAGHPLAPGAQRGFAYRIFTGASLAPGLDAVAMQENCREDGMCVAIPALRKGANVRAAGETLEIGDIPIRAGTRLRPQEIGVAAMLGATGLRVRKQLRVGIFSTGDELREVGLPLGAGCIYDSNRHTLFGLLDGMGCAVTDFGIVADRAGEIRDAMRRAQRDHDLVVTTGGASVGEEDHIKTALAELGHIRQAGVAIKPGKPLVLGQVGETPFIGLPGNPVSAMVGFLLVGRPIVARLSGLVLAPPRRYVLPAGFALDKSAGRREFLRAAIVERDGKAVVSLFRSESSGVLTSMTFADGLVELPEAAVDVAIGDLVPFLPLRELQP